MTESRRDNDFLSKRLIGSLSMTYCPNQAISLRGGGDDDNLATTPLQQLRHTDIAKQLRYSTAFIYTQPHQT